ncbi:MAG TPA: hypothetical protein VJ836_01600 [Candidatus Saccharimonadales bacterium]|nr:hypothetical protein [Candidatus Saccharimonadales bacterium]
MSVPKFKQHLLEEGVLDPEGVHHECAYGAHGRKLDFDRIPTKAPLFREWVDVNAAAIRQRHPKLPQAVLGVADGANRLSRHVAHELGVVALFTHKVSAREVELTTTSRSRLLRLQEGLVVVLKDVCTTGGTAYTAVRSLREAVAREVAAEGQFTWNRQGELRAFADAGIPYTAIIDESLPTYTPEQCQTQGYCAQGWQLIVHAG